MSEQRTSPSGLGMTFLVGGVLLTCLLALVTVFAPFSICPQCHGNGYSLSEYGRDDCGRCHAMGKVTLLNRWNKVLNVPAR